MGTPLRKRDESSRIPKLTWTYWNQTESNWKIEGKPFNEERSNWTHGKEPDLAKIKHELKLISW